MAAPVLPLAMAVALTALELLVAFLQAYVFAVLTCMYLNDALHPGALIQEFPALAPDGIATEF